MDMLNSILGGSRRAEYDDFVQRYDQGAPWDGIDDDEALSRYREVSPNLSDDDYRESAQEAFARLTPEQRAEFGRWLQTQSQQRGVPIDTGGPLDDPGFLARESTRFRGQQPGLLEGMLGGVLGGGSPMSGSNSMGASSSGGNFLSSPIAKAVLGGIAAMAASKVMSPR